MGAACTQTAGGGLPGSVNTGFVRDMRKLSKWSTEQPSRKFDDLWNWVCHPENARMAWRRLRKNKGMRTPGIDGLTVKMIERRPGGRAAFIAETITMLRCGMYRPEPVKRCWIQKPGKVKKRPLGIPATRDRLVQMMLLQVLEPIFEPDFHGTSYGFRPRRKAIMALRTIQNSIQGAGAECWVIEGDIEGFFNNIPHHRLMRMVERRIGDRKVLNLIRAFLGAGVMDAGVVTYESVGTPQGGIISPLLANIYLTRLDASYTRKAGIAGYTRYADDFLVVVTGTREDAEQEKLYLKQFLHGELGLTLSDEKTLVSRPVDGIPFLGYEVVQRNGHTQLRISEEKTAYIEARIREIVAATRPEDTWETLLKGDHERHRMGLNPFVAGNRAYFKHADNAAAVFGKLDDTLQTETTLWLARRYPAESYGDIVSRHTQIGRSGKTRKRVSPTLFSDALAASETAQISMTPSSQAPQYPSARILADAPAPGDPTACPEGRRPEIRPPGTCHDNRITVPGGILISQKHTKIDAALAAQRMRW